MEDLLIIDQEEIQLTDKEIFTKIWTAPREVFKYINDHNYDKYVKLLLILSGISSFFDRASMKNFGDSMSLWAVIAICIIGGGLLGWISTYIYAALMNWTGKWLNGEGNTTSILQMLSYAMIPSIFSMVFLIPQIFIYGNDLFQSDGDISSASLASNVVVYSLMFLEFIVGVLTFVLFVIGTSEVQKLSIGKAVLNVLLPVFVIIIPIGLIFLLVTLQK